MAGLTSTSNNLTDLINTGADALSNLYEVHIKLGRNSSQSLAQDLKVRVGSFDPPKVSQGTYTVRYKSAEVARPNASLSYSHTFTLTFRIDSYWSVYNALKAQKAVTSVGARAFASTGYSSAADEHPDYLANIQVYALQAPITSVSQDKDLAGSATYDTLTKTPLYEFKGCWIQDMTEPRFDYSSSTALQTTVTWGFFEWNDPETRVAGLN